MQISKTLAATVPFLGKALALNAPIPGYEVVVPSWAIEISPGCEPMTINSTVEEMIAQANAINPEWEAMYMGRESRNTEMGQQEHAGFDKRSDFAQVNCNGWDDKAKWSRISQGIRYLHDAPGRPEAHGRFGVCGRVSCSYDSAIWWCNDDPNGKTLRSYGSIADGAQYILDRCTYPHTQYLSGQAFHETQWNVIVMGDDC